jgi:hypothetical protein
MIIMAALTLIGGRQAHAQLSETPRDEAWVTNGTVHAIARTADTVYIGGEFTYVGPNTGSGVPIDAASGQAVATFPQVNGRVLASVSDGASGWYIGGSFTQVGALARANIARILADGTVDPAWNVLGADGVVWALAVSGSTVYAGGVFTSIGGNPRRGFAQFDFPTPIGMDAWRVR